MLDSKTKYMYLGCQCNSRKAETETQNQMYTHLVADRTKAYRTNPGIALPILISKHTQRAQGSKKFILARTHKKKNIPPRTKFSFSLEIFILGLKISFWIEIFNPRPCFSAAREGPGMRISFSIENFVPC